MGVSGDLEEQIKTVGDSIREPKAQLKASGMSGKAIDKSDEVKNLVAKLTALKEAQSKAPAAKPEQAAAGTPAPVAPSGNLEEQIKTVGDSIRELKAKLKADGMSGKAID